MPADLTTLRDPDKNFYFKPDTGAFAIGGWEDGSKGCWRGMPPLDFGRELFAPNMERLELFALPAAERLPVLNEIGIQTVINGPIPVSADGEPIMGLAPELDNFYVACGFTAGIAASGGAGLAMANTILHGDAGMDLWPFDVRRFGALHAQGPLSRGARHRGLWLLLQNPLAGRGGACGQGAEAFAALCDPQGRWAPFTARNSVGSGRTGLRNQAATRAMYRPSKASPTGSMQ